MSKLVKTSMSFVQPAVFRQGSMRLKSHLQCTVTPRASNSAESLVRGRREKSCRRSNHARLESKEVHNESGKSGHEVIWVFNKVTVDSNILGRWCSTGESIPASADIAPPRAMMLAHDVSNFSKKFASSQVRLSKRSVMFDLIGGLSWL